MRRIKCLICSLLGIITITSCGNNKVEHSSSITDNQQPARIAIIEFDGQFVQTYSHTWPIAFDSYKVENNFLSIDGKAYCKHDYEYNIDYLEHYLNDGEGVSIYPYVPLSSSFPSWWENSNMPNFRWDIKKLSENLLFSFTIHIDVSIFIENDATLDDLYISYDFDVIHHFDGESIW